MNINQILIIQIKYNELLERIKKHTYVEIFNKNIPIYELIWYINYNFFDYKDHIEVIKEICRIKKLNVSNETITLIYDELKEFLTFFHLYVRKWSIDLNKITNERQAQILLMNYNNHWMCSRPI